MILSPVADAGSWQPTAETLHRGAADQVPAACLDDEPRRAIVDDPVLGSRFDFEKLRDFMLATPDLVNETSGTTSSARATEKTADAGAARRAADRRAGDARRAERGRPEDRPAPPPPTCRTASPPWQACASAAPAGSRSRCRCASTTGQLELPAPTSAPGSTRAGAERAHPLAAPPVGRAAPSPTSRCGSPERRRRRLRARTSSNYVTGLEPGVPLGLGYDGSDGTWNAAIAPRPGSPCAERGDALDQPRHDRRRARHRLRAALRHAHRRARCQRRTAPARARRAQRRGVATIEGFGLVITNRWFRSLGESGSALREGLRFDADLEARLTEGAGLQLLGRRRAGRADQCRQGAQPQGAEA